GGVVSSPRCDRRTSAAKHRWGGTERASRMLQRRSAHAWRPIMTQVYILGAGTPTPTPDRWGSAFAVNIGAENLMFDCGPAATHKLVKVGIFPTRVDYLFFTHHHFDHDVDYPCFLLCRWDQSVGKENQLQVYGPTLTETITERILGEHG